MIKQRKQKERQPITPLNVACQNKRNVLDIAYRYVLLIRHLADIKKLIRLEALLKKT